MRMSITNTVSYTHLDVYKRQGQGRTAVVTAAYPVRKTIVPSFRFSGTLLPVWQADVAAKIDGRIEKVLVQEGEMVAAGQALVLLEQVDTAAGVMLSLIHI